MDLYMCLNEIFLYYKMMLSKKKSSNGPEWQGEELKVPMQNI
jgi:hypothetical protein